MNKLDLAIAKEFNRQNPITKEIVEDILLNGKSKLPLAIQYKNAKNCSLREAKEALFKVIGELSEIFYTGPASTPTSVGVRLKDNRSIVIDERELTQIETGEETRRMYNECVDEFKRDYFL